MKRIRISQLGKKDINKHRLVIADNADGEGLMDDTSPAVSVTVSLGNSMCDNSTISGHVEITRLKIVTDTAKIVSGESAPKLNGEIGVDVSKSGNTLILSDAIMPESEDDEVLSVVDENNGIICEGLLVVDERSKISLQNSVEDKNGRILAKAIILGESSIEQVPTAEVLITGVSSDVKIADDSGLKASEVVIQLPDGDKGAARGSCLSVYELECIPLWGFVSLPGRRPEMEDAVAVLPRFLKIPIKMLIGDRVINGMSQSLTHLTSHFFGVYDGHGGAQVADYCRDRIHTALAEEIGMAKENLVDGCVSENRQQQWEKTFISSFQKVDDEIGGKASRDVNGSNGDNSDANSEPIAPETVGSTAVVALVCSSHIIVANCGDSRAVLCRGKTPMALSVDHKPNREDECARIEAAGGKVIQWNGHRVFGVLAMSRSIGDRYLKPWIIPEPEVMFIPRARDDECLILASDGLWDVMSNDEACEVARRRILLWHKKNGAPPLLERGQDIDPASQAAADYLSMLALQKGSKDNVSVIVIDLKAQRKTPSTIPGPRHWLATAVSGGLAVAVFVYDLIASEFAMALARVVSRLDEEGVVTAVAIDKDKNSHFAVKWAVDNLVREKDLCILVHVRSQSFNPDELAGSRKEGYAPTAEEIQKFFLPYRGFCARKGVHTKEIILHDIDIPGALIDYANNNEIGNIVVGAASRSPFSWRFRSSDVPSNLLKDAPETCSVFVISSKGKVQSSKAANRPRTPKASNNMPRQDSYQSRNTLKPTESEYNMPRQESYQSRNTQKPNQGEYNVPRQESYQTRNTPKLNQADYNMPRQESYQPRNNQKLTQSEYTMPRQESYQQRNTQSQGAYNMPRRDFYQPRIHNNFSPEKLQSEEINSEASTPRRGSRGGIPSPSQTVSSGSGSSNYSGPSSSYSNDRSLENFSQTSSPKSNSSSISDSSYDSEMRRIKLEIQQQLDMYHAACKEAISAKQKANEMYLGKEEYDAEKAAMKAAQMQKILEETEFHKERIVEMKAQYQALEKERAMHDKSERNKAMDGWSQDTRYKRYSIEEIEYATAYFSNDNKIGEGGYGPVYKAKLDHTAVAIKVLRPDLSEGLKQFHQEVDVLSRIRHPNMVLLLGACPEYGCLIYEHMDNGSLEDRLFMKNNSPPLSWQTRFRIAAEIATALLFLHQTKPEPLVHRDLKPANILLDKNYVSKIADVGLARLVPPSVADSVTQYHMTAAAGTFYYIDPEYQQTGMLGVKSDLYSLGVMLLQIITGKPPAGVSHHMEQAIEKGAFLEMLDPTVRDWPVEEALSLAKVALKCCELRKRDRPDLATVVLPELIRLQEIGMEEEHNYNRRSPYFESHYNPLPPLRPQVSNDLKSL
ncbi:hypothetical protein ACFE04_008585 [Oxalis oulophora]